MQIRSLGEVEAALYRKIRLNALKNDPDVFGSSYEKEASLPLETFKAKLAPAKDKFVLGAFQENGLMGIVTFVREGDLKNRHKGNIFGMYVSPETRGQGVAKALMEQLIDRSKNLDGLEQIKLSVVSTNEAAKQLYMSFGFEVYGVEPNAMKVNSQYLDEDLMVLFI